MTTHRPLFTRSLALTALIMALAAGMGTHQSSAQTDEPPRTLAEWVDTETRALVATLKADGDFSAAATNAQAMFDAAIAHSDRDDLALVRAASARRLVRLVSSAPADVRGATLDSIVTHQNAATELLFLFDEQHDNAKGVVGVWNQLVDAYGDRVEAFPSLTAAICVVFDKGNPRSQIEFAVAQPMGPLEVFEHFASRPRLMVFDPTRLPAMLATSMVDLSVSREDANWALTTYPGDQRIGERYDDPNFDSRHYEHNEPLKLASAQPFSLETIRRVGGVYRHQTYFATQVGKSIGVPTVFMQAESPQGGRAWPGYLRRQGNQSAWDYAIDDGRRVLSDNDDLFDYEDIPGGTIDAQTGQPRTRGEINITASNAGLRTDNIWLAQASLDAINRLSEIAESTNTDYPPANPLIAKKDDAEPERPSRSRRTRGSVRTPSIDDRLNLLRKAAGSAPGTLSVWTTLGGLAPEIEGREMQTWLTAVSRVATRQNPDFLFKTVAPMIREIDDLTIQNRQWEWLGREVQQTPKVVVQVALEQGKMYENAKQPDRAWAIYNAAWERYANEGPFVLDAIKAAESLLVRTSTNQAAILDLYERAFRRIKRPTSISSQYARYTVYAQVGERYADLLEDAGRTNDVENVRRLLKW